MFAFRFKGQFKLLLLVSVLPICGCINSQTTQLPQVQPQHPSVARQEFGRHDPFPNRTAGPDTFTRPRGFNNPRAEARRIQENRLLRGMNNRQHNQQQTPQHRIPTTQQNYPHAIR